MKQKIKHTLKSLLYLLILVSVFTACKKDEEIKPVETLIVNPLQGAGKFVIESDNLKETDKGYDFEGVLKASNEKGNEYSIIDGNISVEVDNEGNITGISGEGNVQFPDIGIFKEILKEFNWKEEILSHIEYEKGSYFKDVNNLDMPLVDDSHYLHFKVLNEDRDGPFELKSKVNSLVYNFFDFYLDINDPSIFFKVTLWKPSGGNGNSTAQKLMSKILDKAKQTGTEIKSFAGAPGLIFGISNQGKILSRSYEFSKPEIFQELYGYSGYDPLPSHAFIKLQNVPIPETFILRFTGEQFIHLPIGQLAPSTDEAISYQQNAFAKWFGDLEPDAYSESFTGKIDMGGKGIALILGVLPQLNDILGYDIFNKEMVNLDLFGATDQRQYVSDLDITNPNLDAYWRIGGEVRVPVIKDIFGAKLAKYIPDQSNGTGFLYLSVGTDLEDWLLHLQGDVSLAIPGFDNIGYNDSYFSIHKSGINMGGHFNRSLGPVNFNSEVTGSLSLDYGLELHSLVTSNILLPNGLELYNNRLEATISTTNGIKLKGNVDLPFGITQAEVTGELSPEGLSLEGSIENNIFLPDGTEIDIAEMNLKLSTKPEEGISLHGYINAPAGIGRVEVEGRINKDEFYLHGYFDSGIDFNGVILYTSNGEIEISNTQGIKISGGFTLPSGLGYADMAGKITPTEIKLSGQLGSKIDIGGYKFTFTNSSITASNITGVQVSGLIDLYVFKSTVSGSINPDYSFNLTGSTNLNLSVITASINVKVTPNDVKLTGNGCIKIGFVDQCGSLSINPNWSAKEIQICKGIACITI
ncbi:MAG: hypothetical protein JXJ22_04140 [Bacteroidales bacterium]|nr:hypothetical protein [Bacteroidales bacterium]